MANKALVLSSGTEVESTSLQVATLLDTNGVVVFTVVATASAVNGVKLIPSVTGVRPAIAAFGSDTNVDLDLQSQAGGRVRINGLLAATLTGGGTMSNMRYTRRIGTVASAAVPTFNTDVLDQYNITALAAAITSMTTNQTGTPNDGDTLAVRIKDNGTARAITWGAKFVAGPAALLTTTVISKTHYNEFVYDTAAAVWVCVLSHTAGY